MSGYAHYYSLLNSIAYLRTFGVPLLPPSGLGAALHKLCPWHLVWLIRHCTGCLVLTQESLKNSGSKNSISLPVGLLCVLR